jgi:cytochrome c oxidase subunit 2
MLYFIQHRHFYYLLSLLLLLGAFGCNRDGPPPPDISEVKIEMTGHDFKWHSRYPGDDGQLGTDDDLHAAQVLHVPVNAEVEIFLKSRDYLYSLEVPQAQRKEIAVPDLTFSLNFKADKIGTFKMPGDQLCGYTHPDLMGTLIVESQADYARWLASQR